MSFRPTLCIVTLLHSEHFKSYKLTDFFSPGLTPRILHFIKQSILVFLMSFWSQQRSFPCKAFTDCSFCWMHTVPSEVRTEYLCVMYSQFVLQIVTSNWTWHLNSSYNFNFFSYFIVTLILPRLFCRFSLLYSPYYHVTLSPSFHLLFYYYPFTLRLSHSFCLSPSPYSSAQGC
jgi:hypothetical protein